MELEIPWLGNNTSLMKVKVSQGTEYLHSLKVLPYKLLITNKRENGNFMVEKFGRHHLFQLLWLNNKLPLDSAPLNSHLLCSWILEVRNLIKEHQGWLVPVPWCWGFRLENLKASNWNHLKPPLLTYLQLMSIQILSMWLVELPYITGLRLPGLTTVKLLLLTL